MREFIYDLKENADNKSFFTSPSKWLRKVVIEEKLINPLGIIFLVGMSLFVGALVGLFGIKPGGALIAVAIGLPILIGAIFDSAFGIICMLVYTYFMATLARLIGGIPFGLVLDVFVAVLTIGMMIQQIGKRDWSFLKNPISSLVFVWIIYNLLEVGNPAASSRLAWVFSVRSFAVILILYYIALYAMREYSFFKNFFNIMVFLSFLAAVYGIFQEFFGYRQFELDTFIHNEEAFNLMFQQGKFRKISFLQDPVVFGVIMAYMAVMCLILTLGPFSLPKRIYFGITAALSAFSMSFSGTRTAYVLIPIGLIFWVLLSHKKNLLILMGIMFIFGAFLVVMPTGNATLIRIQTAFKPADDASFQARQINQARIKPYIHSHPFGGGLGSVGTFGRRFSPGTFLANFPPDSGFVRIVVEQGFIGLAIYFALLYMVLQQGVKHYYRCRDPEIKTYYACMVTTFYILCIASYPQEIFTQWPIPVIMCVFMAMISTLKNFDPNYQEDLEKV